MNQSADNLARPLASEHLQIEETGGEVVVFDTERRLFHFLNATAYTILKACNGANSLRDIAVSLSAKFKIEDIDSLINDVAETINSFQDKGLVTYVVDGSHLQQTAADSTAESPLIAVSVSGSSMFPILLSGDKVLVKKSTLEELAAGDVVIWTHHSQQLVAHRILSIEGSSTPALITTKGDLCFDPDPPVEFDRVLGKIVAVLREGGVQWMRELDRRNGNSSNNGEASGGQSSESASASLPKQKPSYKRMKVLDLREISVESIRNIESVEDIGLVLLSPENAHAWSDVLANDVKVVFTAPEDCKIYTGQPELLPQMLEFLEAPLRLVVSGQLFLTAFEPGQISEAFHELILNGQAYVSSAEAKTALESLTKIVSGEICVVPPEHTRWIGTSILGPEYLSNSQHLPLVSVGELTISKRLESMPESFMLFNNVGGN